MSNIIITDDNRKFDLSNAQDLGITTREHHGVSITGVYKTKSGKIIVGTYSLWNDGTGSCIGQSYHIAGQDEIATLAREYESGGVLEAMIPLEE